MDCEDEYWNRSESKAFDFSIDDDDRATFLTVREDIKQRLIYDDNLSEISYEIPVTEDTDIPLNVLISDGDLQIVLDEQSLSDVQFRKGCPADEELRFLRRKLQDRYHAPEPHSIVDKIVANKPVSLDCFRSMAEKRALLDAAMQSVNSNAILLVVLFLVRTLMRSHILPMMRDRPCAIRTYLNYLKCRQQLSEAAHLLSELGHREDLAFLQFAVCCLQNRDRRDKANNMRQLYQEHFQQPGNNRFLAQCVADYQHLLDWQSSQKTINGLEGLDDSSVMQTLYYACSRHKWSEGPQCHYDPSLLVERQKVSAAQHEWVALTERARAQSWRDCEQLFAKKSWHSLKATSFAIHVPLEAAIWRLYRLDAPVAILNAFLARIPDSRRRLWLAQKMDATRSVVDALVERKDRVGLETYMQSIAAGTDVRFYAENALKTLKTKWVQKT